ncbi:adhesin [Bacillus mangrovi]|uniref:Adhesin n=1 Tax=Metabacillus mangrovi TaxID=1491830 RepID=A0A7X2V3C8_9BACI|nr:iron-sulfur cluster biosynthesis family protein [Metabacillus mangrovi]MTH51883.1 adhesin [Metabacillus mangrovi]
MEITNDAKEKLMSAMQEHKASCVRLYLMGQGCCGPQIGLGLDEPGEEDTVQEINGIQVAIDQLAVSAAENVTLDFQNDGFMLKGLPENNC